MRTQQAGAPETLEQLIGRARALDTPEAVYRAAFGVLVERFQEAAYGYALTLLGDPHLAWDAAQEAFLTAYCSLDQLRTPAAFPGWLRRIVRTHCRRLRREQQPFAASLDTLDGRAPGASLPASRFDAQVDPALVIEGRERRAALASAVRALPTGQRLVTRLFYVGGYPQQQIAARLSLPLTTVKKRLQAARRHLQARMVVLMADDLPRQRTPRPGRSFAARFVRMLRVLTLFATPDANESLLELLLVDGLDVNTPDDDGRTLLSWAAQRGQVETISWLLERGAWLNARDRAGLTPLGWAERTQQHAAAALLRQSGGVR